jgi:hypothetical protein
MVGKAIFLVALLNVGYVVVGLIINDLFKGKDDDQLLFKDDAPRRK